MAPQRLAATHEFFRRILIGALAAAAALACATPAQALTPTDLPPVGADAGRFSLPIDCAITDTDLGGISVFDLKTSVDIQGVAPASLGPGQQFFLTEGSGSMTFPSWLTGLGAAVGITTADATVREMNIGARNATPAAINLASTPIQIPGIPITGGKDLVVGLPTGGGTFPDIGPYTAPDHGIVTLEFTGAVVDVALKASWGLVLHLRASCTPVAGNGLLSMAVGGAPGQPPAAFHGVPLHYPAVGVNQQVGIIHAPYRCTALGSRFDVGIAVGAQLPLSVDRATGLTFTDASGALVLPAGTVNQLLDAGFTGAAGTVTELTLTVDGGTPTSQNVIPAGGIPIPPTAFTRGQPLVVPLPAGGTLTAGPYLPAAGANHLVVSLGTAAATLRFTGGTGDVSATCAAPDPQVVLYDAPVTG